MHRVAILAATRRELSPIHAACRLVGHLQSARLGSFAHHWVHYRDVELHLIKTGIGPDQASKATELVIARLSPDALISSGYVGALGKDGYGALLLSTDVIDWISAKGALPFMADPGLLQCASEAAQEAGMSWSRGPVVTVSHIVWRVADKQALAQASGAIGVDMESAAIAKAAASAHIPFLTIRAVSDGVTENLPIDFNLWFSASGTFRGMMQIMTHPSILLGLYRMKQQADLASETLRQFFSTWVMTIESSQHTACVSQPVANGLRR